MAWHDTISVDGISNEDVGVVLQSSLSLSAPEPNVQIYRIPGRSGDIIETDGTFKNRTATVSAYIYKDNMVRKDMGKVYEWLFSSQGYRKLTTNADPDHFLLARIVSGGNIVDRINKMIPFDIVFDCKPERFLTSGDSWKNEQGATSIYNNTNYDAKPVFKVFGSFEMTVNGVSVAMTVDLNISREAYAYFDTELQMITVYNYADKPVRYIYIPEKIIFPAQYNSQIIFESTSTNNTTDTFGVKPRWWEL